ncbi:MAG TPA: 3',5'-cyclic-AMP phosphodiesterase [Methylothermaceae bacterium]|nr:3',5'-cyclic-AMP phosphodiesterase [Methylothermaceae bacterium]
MAMTLELSLPPRAPVKLLQLSDCHFLEQPGDTLMGVDTEQSFHSVLASLRQNPNWPADLILLTGDLVQNPTRNAYQRLFRHLRNIDIPWVCLPGNHDDLSLIREILCREKAHCSKRILAGRWQILCLNSKLPDSHAGHLAAEELDFLAQSLAQNPIPTLVALHHPPLPVGSTWMDTMQLDNSEQLFSVLNHYPHVRGIIFGHIHQVFEVSHNGIPLWSVPSTCFQFKPKSSDFALDELPPGWRWLKLQPDGRIDTWVERLDACPPGLDFSQSGY